MLRGGVAFIVTFVLLVVVAGGVGLTVGPYELLLALALAAGIAVMLTHRSRPS